jgi:nitroreductase/NAD-dependent dihydropyrimidine dehydrogenase PreA subunit
MGKESIEKTTITVNNHCIECGKCVEICPVGALTYENDPSISKKPIVFDSEVCIFCGHCIAVCPKDAISHSRLPCNTFQKIDSFQKLDWDQFVHFTRQRRSIRKFSGKPVPIELIGKILDESARYSPTGHNRQTTKIVILEGERLKSVRDEMNKMIVHLNGLLNLLRVFSEKMKSEWKNMRAFKHVIELGMDPSTRNAPMAVLLTADKRIKESEADAMILSYQTLLSAEILGLKSCYFGALINTLPYSRKLRKLIKIPSCQKLTCGLLLGYSDIRYHKLIGRKPVDFTVL